jgi:hypothetical protein
MKTNSLLSHAALVTSAAFFIGLACDAQALALFSLASCTYLLLVVATDYAKRVPLHRGAAASIPRGVRYVMPLAI